MSSHAQCISTLASIARIASGAANVSAMRWDCVMTSSMDMYNYIYISIIIRVYTNNYYVVHKLPFSKYFCSTLYTHETEVDLLYRLQRCIQSENESN